MKFALPLFLYTLLLCEIGCATNVKPVATKMATSTMRQVEEVFDENEVHRKQGTFLGKPADLLGQVIVMRVDETNSVNHRLFQNARLTGFSAQPSAPIRYSTEHTLALTDKHALRFGYLPIIGTAITSTNCGIFHIRTVERRRVVENASWANAIKQWQTANKGVISDPHVTNIFVVKGYEVKEVSYTLLKAQKQALSVIYLPTYGNGRNEAEVVGQGVDHIFSLEIVSIPKIVPTSAHPAPKPRKPTTNELKRLRQALSIFGDK